MMNLSTYLDQSAFTDEIRKCTCGNAHVEPRIETIEIHDEAIGNAAKYLKTKDFRHPVMVVDANTVAAAGKRLAQLLTENHMSCTVVSLSPNENGDVLADEKAIVQVLLESPKDADVFLAVGAGTIHDITRFVSFKLGVPFVAVPTAPSVDGFNSMGSPLIIKGIKTTYQLQSPIAVFADLAVLKEAPLAMRAAGFGDMLAKFTSLLDWRFSHIMKDEPFCPLSYQITEHALQQCITHMDAIATGTKAGIYKLMESLIVSGLSMLLTGNSNSASGGEHHVSHVWEMAAIKDNKKQQLHGAKVGVTSILIAQRYKSEFREFLVKGVSEDIGGQDDFKLRLKPHVASLLAQLDQIPDQEGYRSMLKIVGGVLTPEELNVSEALLESSLKEAHRVRARYTILRFLNERLQV